MAQALAMFVLAQPFTAVSHWVALGKCTVSYGAVPFCLSWCCWFFSSETTLESPFHFWFRYCIFPYAFFPLPMHRTIVSFQQWFQCSLWLNWTAYYSEFLFTTSQLKVQHRLSTTADASQLHWPRVLQSVKHICNTQKEWEAITGGIIGWGEWWIDSVPGAGWGGDGVATWHLC